MSQSDVKPVLDWQEIAVRVAAEKDPDRLINLARELIEALDKRTNELLAKVPPNSKMPEHSAT